MKKSEVGSKRIPRTIVFVTYESELSKAGGLGAVMEVLPRHVMEKEDCLVLTPYFKRIFNLEDLLARGKIESYEPLPGFSLTIGRETHEVELTLVRARSGLKICLIWSPKFFSAPENPYMAYFNVDLPMDHFTNPVNSEALIESSLFLCAAAPEALMQLMSRGLISAENLVLHLQDWETACTLKALYNYPELAARTGCMLTLHNPYDQYLGWRNSYLIHDLLRHLHLWGEHVLPQIMPEIHGPITTVSTNFARELLEDPLQREVLAGGLNWLLHFKGLQGIDNGLFGQLRFPFSDRAREMAENGNYDGLRLEKMERRQKLAKDISSYIDRLQENGDAQKQPWGPNLDLDDPSIPVFLIIGRDDPRQKGYDVIAEAIWRLPPGRARYVFTPIPGDEGLLGLEFLRKLAIGRPGEVMVFPFRLAPESYMSLQRGSFLHGHGLSVRTLWSGQRSLSGGHARGGPGHRRTDPAGRSLSKLRPERRGYRIKRPVPLPGKSTHGFSVSGNQLGLR